MALIAIRDLADSREMDRQARQAVLGGMAGPMIKVDPHVNVAINQSTNISQVFDINVLNNTDLSGMQALSLNLGFSPVATAANVAQMPGLPV